MVQPNHVECSTISNIVSVGSDPAALNIRTPPGTSALFRYSSKDSLLCQTEIPRQVYGTIIYSRYVKTGPARMPKGSYAPNKFYKELLRISSILKGLNNGTRDTVICKKTETHDAVN